MTLLGERPSQAGVASVLAVALVGALAAVALGVVLAGGVLAARHRAQSAADLAALAGASALAVGEEPCASARRITTRNGAVLGSCRVAGRDVLVRVSVTAWLVRGRGVPLAALARAGPAQGAVR